MRKTSGGELRVFHTNIPPGGRGNLGMNTFRKDGTANWNVALGRNFRVAGERSLDGSRRIHQLLQYAAPVRQAGSATGPCDIRKDHQHCQQGAAGALHAEAEFLIGVAQARRLNTFEVLLPGPRKGHPLRVGHR